MWVVGTLGDMLIVMCTLVPLGWPPDMEVETPPEKLLVENEEDVEERVDAEDENVAEDAGEGKAGECGELDLEDLLGLR